MERNGRLVFGSAEKTLLAFAVLTAAVFPIFPVTSHGIVNWYVTGIDDLLIFSATYLIAKKRGQTAFAVAGLLSAVACMLVLVAFAGGALASFSAYAKWAAVVPFAYAAKESYALWKGGEEGDEIPEWWMKCRTFGRAFFGFAANCLDDIALNASMVAGAYAGHSAEYLTGIAFGALSMVVLAAIVGKAVRDYPALHVAGYALAGIVILWS